MAFNNVVIVVHVILFSHHYLLPNSLLMTPSHMSPSLAILIFSPIPFPGHHLPP
jgi:hypothetical protein